MRLRRSIPRFCTLVTAFLFGFATGSYISQVEATFQSVPSAGESSYVLSLDVQSVELSTGASDSPFLRWRPVFTPTHSTEREDFSPASVLRSLQLPLQPEHQCLVLGL